MLVHTVKSVVIIINTYIIIGEATISKIHPKWKLSSDEVRTI